MNQKIAILLVTISIMILGIYLYSNKSTPLPTNRVHTDTGMISPSSDTGYTQMRTPGEPPVMRTGSTMDAGSGVSVTIITNGPDTQPMTPAQQRAFQQAIQGK